MPLTRRFFSILGLAEGPGVLQLPHYFLLLDIEALELEAKLLELVLELLLSSLSRLTELLVYWCSGMLSWHSSS